MSDSLLSGGLTRRTGYADDGLSPKAPHARGQRLQGNERIFDRKQRRVHGVTGVLILANDRRNCASLQRLCNEIVTIQPFALHGKKELAGLNRARVDGISPRYGFRVEPASRGGG